MPNSLSTAKCLKMATPTFFGHATGKIAVSPKSVELPAGHILENMFRGANGNLYLFEGGLRDRQVHTLYHNIRAGGIQYYNTTICDRL